ncbi:exonuclease domain-containing protein [Salipaludibacillus aurantiacus]|uniref:DNA polymerase-3 subunit epsilon n=1 Tax=Salipaludibacillus aurantiacus TaxID=1601833 RepID=A0A1H9VQV4_9BACI|nr:exonuclease domain-containing protein [Salipaludibacillus aurantiacus]SES24035.1 DNA polymerase-3 subunit epsilon [Salipaludibacillus aurantiacus]
MNTMGSWIKQLSGMMTQNRYTDGLSERDPAKIAYIRRLQKALKQKDHLSIPFSDLPVTVFDIETTGFYPQKGDTVLSIGALKVRGTHVLEHETFYSLIKTEQPPSDEVQKITHLSHEELIKAPSPEEVLHAFFHFAGKDTLVAHHAGHEAKFMQHMMWSLFKTRFEHRILDTSFLTKLIKPMEKLTTLEECCTHYGIDLTNRHHAYHDAVMAAKIWSQCIPKVEKQGFSCLKDVYSHLASVR